MKFGDRMFQGLCDFVWGMWARKIGNHEDERRHSVTPLKVGMVAGRKKLMFFGPVESKKIALTMASHQKCVLEGRLKSNFG